MMIHHRYARPSERETGRAKGYGRIGETHGPPDSGWWSRWGAVTALVWSAGAVALGALWLTGWLDSPFTDPELVSMGAVLNALDPAVGAVLVSVLGVAGIVAAVVVTQDPPPRAGWGKRVVEGIGWVIAGVCALLLVSGWLLMALAYALALPMLVMFVPGIFPEFVAAVTDPQLLLGTYSIAGAFIWGLVTLRYRRRVRHTCAGCGRQETWSQAREQAARLRMLRISQFAVAAGAVAALIYPVNRFLWLFGVGADMGELPEEAVTIGVSLAGAAVVGLVLMTGLVSSWGVRFPRWMVGLAGRRVPISLAVVPAIIVAITLVALGRGVLSLPHHWLEVAGGSFDMIANFVALSAMLPWGIALGVAAIAYAMRRRAVCATCGQGAEEVAPPGLKEVSPGDETTRSTAVTPR